MQPKRKKAPKRNPEFVAVRLYGIFNLLTRKMVKVSLDQEDIDMELALSTDKNLTECTCNVTLII